MKREAEAMGLSLAAYVLKIHRVLIAMRGVGRG
jgi:hypothetical protein